MSENANYVKLGDKVLVDLREDTATEDTVFAGFTFHKADGTPAIGTGTSGGTGFDISAALTSGIATDVVIQKGASMIIPYLFYKQQNIETITIPDSVTEIGSYAFYMCSALTSITIPDSVTEIGSCAFYMCSALTSLMIPNGVTIIEDNMCHDCTALTSITIPDSVTEIGSYAFSNCKNMVSAEIKSRIRDIQSYSFSNCTKLESITIPNVIAKIGTRAFYSCISLIPSLPSLPSTISEIGGEAFGYCQKLSKLDFYGTPRVIASNAFTHCNNLTEINVPWDVEYLAGAPWGATNATINYNCVTKHFTETCVDINPSKTLTATINCSVGDMVVAAISTRSEFTISDGWTLISTSLTNSTDDTDQRLAFAYKFAENTNESITVTQNVSNRLYINLVGLTGATRVVGNDYHYVDEPTMEVTVNKPSKMTIWACVSPLWTTAAPYGNWTCTNPALRVNIDGSTAQPRLAVFLDQAPEGTSTIFYNQASSTVIVGSVTVEGIDNFGEIGYTGE